MKLVKKLADWKTWVFFILPILLFIAWIAILIYADKNSIDDPALIIFGQVLFTISVLLMFSSTFKKLTLISRIASGVFTACFIALQVATMVLIPTLCALDNKVNNLHDTLFEMTSEDPEYEQTHKAWREAIYDVNDLTFTVEMLNGASLFAISLASVCSRSKKEEAELNEQNTGDGNATDNSDGEQQAEV